MKIHMRFDGFGGGGAVFNDVLELSLSDDSTFHDVFAQARAQSGWARIEAPVITRVDGKDCYLAWGNDDLAKADGTPLCSDKISDWLAKP